MKDYYQILGIPQEASVDDIRRRYRFLAQAYHPDKFPDSRNKDQAEAEFKLVQEAYRVLSNPRQRAAYDRKAVRRGDRSRPPQRPQPGPVEIIVEEDRSPAPRRLSYLRRRTMGLTVGQWGVATALVLNLIVRDPIPLWDELFLLVLFFTIDPILALLGY